MTQHTPGPWESHHRASDPGRKWSGTHHTIEVAMVGRVGVVADTLNRDCVIDPKEDATNARLIAAAPDLLAAAKAVLHGLDARIMAASEVGVPLPVFDGIAALHSAIAKAEGQPS